MSYFNLAKVGVEGSNPFARSMFQQALSIAGRRGCGRSAWHRG